MSRPQTILFLGLVCMLSLASAQKPTEQNAAAPPGKPDPETAITPTIPTHSVQFGDGVPIPGADASIAMTTPIQCSPEGVLYVDELLPPKFREQAVVSLGAKEVHSFSYGSATGLSNVQLRSFFPGDSSVALLVWGSPNEGVAEAGKDTGVGSKSSGSGTGEQKYYILLFNLDGTYRSKTELPSGNRFQFTRVAVLASGKFVLLGYDRVNLVPVLQLYSDAGQNPQSIALTGEMERDGEIVKGQAGGALRIGKAASSLSLWQFAAVGKSVVLYDPMEASTVLEVGEGGSTREIEVESPQGYQLDAIIPSTGKWIARFRKSGISLTDSGAVDSTAGSGNFLLYEIDRSDGSLRARIELPASDSVFDPACEADGKLMAIRSGSDSKFMIFTADLSK